MNKKQLSFLTLAFSLITTAIHAQNYQDIIEKHWKSNKNDSFQFKITNVDKVNSLNADVIKVQYTYNDTPVYGAVSTILIKNEKIIYSADSFKEDTILSFSTTKQLSTKSAYKKATEYLDLEYRENISITKFNEKSDEHFPIKYRMVYAQDNNALHLAYEFLISDTKSPNYWNVIINANTGKLIHKTNLNVSCNFHSDAFLHDDKMHSNHIKVKDVPLTTTSSEEKKTSTILNVDNASYNIFPFPLEAPTFGSRTIINNPWDLNASPSGWHSNGTTSFTTTKGNNVHAYDDKLTFGFGASPDGGATRVFNFPYSSSASATENLNASTTNLFYANNMVHDIFYKFGFNEAARNFQDNNFSNGGTGNDYVKAESQDGGGYNNANFATPPDGISGKMQMYLWEGSPTKLLFYNTPSDAINREPIAGKALFGLQLNDVGVTADVKLSPVLNACSALTDNSLSNKIGLIERGECPFTQKVKNAQNAGAKGVIVYNNLGGSEIGNMGGTDNTITIPSIIIDNPEGEFIKNKLNSGTVVNVTLRKDIRADGSFDNGIIIHEYGHGISNRLTGDGYGCLTTSGSKEQMGEGWSDFFALMLTNQAGASADIPRGIGTYAQGQPTTGGGIRPAKYSPDFSINDFTYGNTNGMEFTTSDGTLRTDVHSVGFVWATMLWDLHWNFVQQYGYASDVTADGDNGSKKVLQLVINGLKLQVCNPSFIDGRNAILQADLASGGQDRCMIWRTFAKRGLGLNADAGEKDNLNDQVEDFTVPTDCALGTDEIDMNKEITVYPNPAKAEFFINFPSNILGKVKIDIYDITGKLVYTMDKVFPKNKKSIPTTNIPNGMYIVKITGLGINASTKLLIKK